MLGVLNRGPAFPIGKGEAHVKVLLVGTDRRSRSRVRVRIVRSSSLAWVQVLEDWGAYLKVVLEDIPVLSTDIRQLVTSATPSITVSQALDVEPQGPWDGCMFTHAPSPKDFVLVGTLLKRWQPAIAILSLGAYMTRSEALHCLSSKPLHLLSQEDDDLPSHRRSSFPGRFRPLCRILMVLQE